MSSLEVVAESYVALRDKNELSSPRLFLGKGRDDASLLALYDIKGRPRIRLRVGADATAKLECLDDEGNVSVSIPE